VNNILEVRDLTKAFDGLLAVNSVSFEVGAGELLALIGPNGAGKSTCFNMLMGQLKPTAGEVPGTYSSMTVVENVQMALLSHHRRLYSMLPYAHKIFKKEAMVFLEMVGLSGQAERHCAILAYGDLKRLDYAVDCRHC